jgi:hypothetical protein
MCHMCTAGTHAHMLEMRVHESWRHAYCIDFQVQRWLGNAWLCQPVLHVDFRSFSDDAPLTYDRMTG